MSEEMKCPVCGGDRDTEWMPVDREWSCNNCLFMCNTADLQRIATAMELARATVKVHESEAPANSVVYDYDRAARRVLKVWREE